MSAATRTVAKERKGAARASVAQPERAPPIEREPEPKATPFADWWRARQANKPDWTYEGFEKACEKWLAFCGTKHCHSPMEMMEFIAHKVAEDLRQRRVECRWIMTDKEDGRPYVKITMADRWVYYHDVAVTIPKMP